MLIIWTSDERNDPDDKNDPDVIINFSPTARADIHLETKLIIAWFLNANDVPDKDDKNDLEVNVNFSPTATARTDIECC